MTPGYLGLISILTGTKIQWDPGRQRILNNPAAERLLSQVRYQASVTRDEYTPTRRDNIGVLVISAFKLIGILLAFAIASGLAMGGFRAFRRRGGRGDEADALTTLHLN